MTKKQLPTFKNFWASFPEVDPPMTLTFESIKDFSSLNKPFPARVQQEFLGQYNPDDDEFMEFIPAVKSEISEDVLGVIFARTTLLSYEYILATYNKKGEAISQKVIWKFQTDGTHTKQTATRITEDWIIFVAENLTQDDQFDHRQSTIYNFEILPDGNIIQYNPTLN